MTQVYPYEQSARLDVMKFLPNISDQMCVLEIGCSTGQFRANFPGKCLYWGIEPAESIAQIASAHLDRVLVGTFDEVADTLPDNYFDCVVCNDVIEHMFDVDFFLEKIKAKMSDTGIIVGSVPNVRFFDNLFRLLILKDWKYVDTGVLDKTHVRFFTQKSLTRTFLLNGYEVEDLAGINGIKLKSPVDGYKATRFILRLSALIISFFIGRDTRFAQFGFRIRPTRKWITKK